MEKKSKQKNNDRDRGFVRRIYICNNRIKTNEHKCFTENIKYIRNMFDDNEALSDITNRSLLGKNLNCIFTYIRAIILSFNASFIPVVVVVIVVLLFCCYRCCRCCRSCCFCWTQQ